MSVTSHMKAFMIETMRTRESRIIFVDNLFLKESQCLRRLEGGARRISSHDGTVQQRLPLVHLQQAVVLSEEAEKFIVENAYDPVYGARPLKRYIQKYVETLSAKLILADEVREGSTIRIVVEDGRLKATAE